MPAIHPIPDFICVNSKKYLISNVQYVFQKLQWNSIIERYLTGFQILSTIYS